MNKKNLLLIAVCAILLLLVYVVDLFKLDYCMADWNEFGNAPVTSSHVQYFVADTPNIITYLDHDLGQNVTCFEAVAFVQAGTQETYRCCDADGTTSCLEGDFSSDIPSTDEQCVAELRQIFGVPEILAGSKEYQFFGKCSGRQVRGIDRCPARRKRKDPLEACQSGYDPGRDQCVAVCAGTGLIIGHSLCTLQVLPGADCSTGTKDLKPDLLDYKRSP